jgi:hypothetical protein
MTNLARCVTIRLGPFECRLDLALKQVSASVLVVLLPGIRDVDCGGLRILCNLDGPPLARDYLNWRYKRKDCEQN